jgi:hypothetical protein
VEHDWKNIKSKKTNKDRRQQPKKIGANPVCVVRDHSDPFDGTLGSYKILNDARNP